MAARKKWRRIVRSRPLVQVSALILSNAYILSALRFIPCSWLQCSNCAASTFACPLILIQRGAVMASMGMIGGLSSKFTGSAAAAMAMLVLFAAIGGAFACAWLCPFGFLQDLLAKIPVKKFTLPAWSGILRLPVFFGLVIAVPYLTRSLAFCDLCPSGTINRFWQQAAGIPLFFKTPAGAWAAASITLFVLVIMAAVFIHRPFCSLLCPIGGFSGLFNRVSGLFIRVNDEKCADCGRCADLCPRKINPVRTPSHSQCDRCLRCTTACENITADLRL